MEFRKGDERIAENIKELWIVEESTQGKTVNLYYFCILKELILGRQLES